MRIGQIVWAIAFTAGLPMAANAATVFSENFDNEEVSGNHLNYNSFDQFTVSAGTVDLINNANTYGISCFGGAGFCVDLDGSTSNAGRMTSDLIALQSGQTYTLSFAISGNQRNGPTNTLDFGIDGGPTWQIIRDDQAPWETLSFNFTVGSTDNYSLFFDQQGGNNVGMILDEVSITTAAVPLPAGLPLLVAGLGSLYVARRRSR